MYCTAWPLDYGRMKRRLYPAHGANLLIKTPNLQAVGVWAWNPAFREAEAGGPQAQAQLGQFRDLLRTCLRIKNKERAGDVAQ